ncbi:MAG TPA: ferritin family protein [Burkholderiales bacterium]|nr:ferritin family protein [Burkholderiales bacterium]
MIRGTTIAGPAALYAHALAIEREAAERYRELAERMADLGNDEAAGVFRQLAGFEAAHLKTLQARTAGISVPAIAPGAYAWLDEGAPETAARELVYRLLTPRKALAIALEAERRAEHFFEEVQQSARDPALRDLAAEMRLEEQDHIAMVLRALAQAPAERVDWAAVLGE